LQKLVETRFCHDSLNRSLNHTWQKLANPGQWSVIFSSWKDSLFVANGNLPPSINYGSTTALLQYMQNLRTSEHERCYGHHYTFKVGPEAKPEGFTRQT